MKTLNFYYESFRHVYPQESLNRTSLVPCAHLYEKMFSNELFCARGVLRPEANCNASLAIARVFATPVNGINIHFQMFLSVLTLKTSCSKMMINLLLRYELKIPVFCELILAVLYITTTNILYKAIVNIDMFAAAKSRHSSGNLIQIP